MKVKIENIIILSVTLVCVFLFLTSKSTKGITGGEIFFAIIFVFLMWIYCIFSFTIRKKYVNLLFVKMLAGLFVAIALISYGSLISVFYGHNIKNSYQDFYRFFGIFIAFPIATCAKSKQNYFLILIITLGIAASIRDILTLKDSSETIRLASLEFANIDYFLALILSIGIIFLTNKIWTRILAIICLYPLIFRTFFSINRSAIIIMFTCLVLFLLKAISIKSIKKELIIIIMITIGFLLITISSEFLEDYLKLWQVKMERLDIGYKLRLAEAKEVINIFFKRPFGDGIGSKAFFTEFSTFGPKSTIPYKGYVHNLFLFLIWKFGIIGIFLCGIIILKILHMLKIAWKAEPEVWLVSIGIIALFLYSFFETYFMRHDFNILLGILLGIQFNLTFKGGLKNKTISLL